MKDPFGNDIEPGGDPRLFVAIVGVLFTVIILLG